MSRLLPLVGAVTIAVIASAFAEGILSPLLKPLLTGPRDIVLVNTLGDVVAAIVAVGAFLFIGSKKPKS